MKTEHDLEFEVADWYLDDILGGGFKMFRVGTMEGLWRCTDAAYEVLTFKNKQQGNGHLTDTLQWFEFSAKRDKREFRILEVMNKRFEKHLISQRGFKIRGNYLFKK